MNAWYTVFCKPRGEEVAETNLRRQGYSVYLPRLLTRRRRAGNLSNCISPLFPRYLFLRPRDSAQSLAPVRSTLGVATIVRFGLRPALVAEAIIEQLRRCEDAVAGMHFQQNSFPSGATVKFIDGPFSGLEAIFSKETGEDRVIVLLEMLGKTNSLTVDSTCLAAAA
jgi:transcriptional antiterminator RfaH